MRDFVVTHKSSYLSEQLWSRGSRLFFANPKEMIVFFQINVIIKLK